MTLMIQNTGFTFTGLQVTDNNFLDCYHFVRWRNTKLPKVQVGTQLLAKLQVTTEYLGNYLSNERILKLGLSRGIRGFQYPCIIEKLVKFKMVKRKGLFWEPTLLAINVAKAYKSVEFFSDNRIITR